jgi:outer membrane lipoprotein-sorting protein
MKSFSLVLPGDQSQAAAQMRVSLQKKLVQRMFWWGLLWCLVPNPCSLLSGQTDLGPVKTTTQDSVGMAAASANPTSNVCRGYFNTTTGLMAWVYSTGSTCGPSGGGFGFGASVTLSNMINPMALNLPIAFGGAVNPFANENYSQTSTRSSSGISTCGAGTFSGTPGLGFSDNGSGQNAPATFTSSITGTANALAGTPFQCSGAGQFSTGIAAKAFFRSLLRLAPAHPQAPASTPLEAVLKKMDTAAASFRATQADFEWDRYEKVIDEVDDIQTGTIYYRRAGKDIEMMADIKMEGDEPTKLKPEPKYVLFRDGKINIYLPKADQVTVYDAGKNRAEVENYLVLGFGGSGQDLVKSWDVTYVGPETINGVATAQLKLVPKSEKVRSTFSYILLWIDLERGVSVQQKLVSPQGDYRLARYSAIQMKEKIGDDVFKLKTTSKTQTISPRG